MSLRYVLKEGVAGLKRARLAVFTSTFSLFIAVFLIGILVWVGYHAWGVAQDLRSQVEVEVFLEDIDDQSLAEIRNRLEELEMVEELVYISRDSAATIFQEEFGYGSESLASISFLPASFTVTLQGDARIDDVDLMVADVGTWPGVDEVRFNMALLQMLQSRIETALLVGGGLTLLIVFAAVVLVFNTIRLTIYAKRDLIRAMKLVGATNGFIRRPFLVEGLFQGLIAGVVASGLLYLLFTLAVPVWVPQAADLGWPYGEWYYLAGSMVVAALIMGWWGSHWASRKFIRDTAIYR